MFIASFWLAAHAEDKTNYDEPGISQGRDYLEQHFAEHIDPFSGNLSLQYTDLVLPGNGGFDIRVQRSYNANSISLLQSAFGRGWDIHFGRVTNRGTTCGQASSQSLTLVTPDGANQTLHRSNGVGGTVAGTDYVTTTFWRASCDSVGGITVLSPNGTKYEMDEVGTNEWHASRITDRFGNSLALTYGAISLSGRKLVTQIVASDGRVVTFSYSAGKLVSISGGGVTWSYSVTSAPDGSTRLSQVTPPAGGGWQYAYNDNLGNSIAGSYALRQITNPFGGVVTYSYSFANFLPNFTNWSPATAVSQKVAGQGTWSYAYAPGCPGGDYDTTTITLPDGVGQLVYKHFGYCTVAAGDVWKIGLLYQKTSGSVQTETYTWSPHAISSEQLLRPNYGKSDTQISQPLMSKATISRDGNTYVTTYSNWDDFGNPGLITESGTRSRTRSLSYFNNTAAWIVGVEKDETNTAGSIARAINADGSVSSETRYGVTTSYSYAADGSLSSKTTAKPATTTYSFARGVAETENRPDSSVIHRQTNALGFITSQTDGEFTRTFTYDGIGRLTSIGYPAGSDATIGWSPTSRTFSRAGYVETANVDGFGRVTTLQRSAVTRTFGYDALGRKIFESLPGSASGITYTFDILGRVSTAQSSAGTKTYTYGADGSVSVRNERGYQTKYLYDRYGNPDGGYLIGIDAPDATASVSMSRNTEGVLLSARQAGITRDYGRDSRFFLTSITGPEKGTTAFGRDGVGNMVTKTEGGITTSYAYDGMNRLKTIWGPVSVNLDYNPRGLVTRVANSDAIRTYTYDANANLATDTLAIDGRTFTIAYGYDVLDGLASITYPMGKGQVAYAPDALGRPQAVSPYISVVGHFASGNLSSLSYANGVSQTFTENSLQLPSGVTAAAIGIGITYQYDNVGNVEQIADAYDASNTRVLTYDSVDRLKTATGPWGSGSVTYDIGANGFGNIASQTFGNYSVSYSYVANRLSSVRGSISRTYTYDSAGNVTGDGISTYDFDALSQMTCANCGSASEIAYQYDGQGRRISQSKAGKKTYFIQAPNGDLQFEYTPFGKEWTKHAYLHGKRVASESGSDAVATSTTVTATPASSVYGQIVNVTATVSAGVATGDVAFNEGGVALGVVSLSGNRATLSLANLNAGAHSITATYQGDANNQASFGSSSVTVSKVNVATSLGSSASSTSAGQSVLLTATVSGSNVTGQVQFADGGTPVGLSNVVNGVTTIFAPPLTAGSHTFTAMYLGDPNHNAAASAAVNVAVSQVSSSITVWSSGTPSIYAQPVTFIATVAGTGGLAPGGTVTFMDAGNLLGSSTLTAGGTATFVSNSLSAGTHNISASYAGDTSYLASNSVAFAQQINRADTLTSMVLPGGPYARPQSTVITASVAGPSPSGQVTFMVNGAALGSSGVSNGTASTNLMLRCNALAVSASYSGDTNTTPSASPTAVIPEGHWCSDVNADGKSDVLLRNTASGAVRRIFQDGLTSFGDVTVYTEPDLNWKVINEGDFNGDGVTDLLWRNVSTGAVAVSPFNPSGTITSRNVIYQQPDLSWQVAQTGDVDGNGKTDLIWWNSGTGEASVMLLDGNNVLVNSVISVQPDTRWRIVAAGDFNGTGKRNQLVWRNTTTGEVSLQTVSYSGGAFSASAQTIYQQPDTNWRIVTAADFNHDGKADLLWFNGATGEVMVMLMNGAAILNQAVVWQGGAPWNIVATGDYNGDGQADIAWQNADDGTTCIVLMNGLASASASGCLAPLGGSAWHVLGPYEYANVDARLVNISTRAYVGTGNDVLIAGFIIDGNTTKNIVVQGQGPSLTAQGVPGALSNPTLMIVRSSDGVIVATNDDWGTDAHAADLQALNYAPTHPLDSALLLLNLPPGAYSAILSGVAGATGVGLVGIYEVDNPKAQFSSLSSRGLVQTGDNIMIGGLVIGGTTPRRVLIRGKGPSMAAAGITNPLSNPLLQLFDSANNQIAVNDDWGTSPQAAAIQATGLAPTDAREAAIFITLNPGRYSAFLTGAGGTTGVGLLEIFPE